MKKIVEKGELSEEFNADSLVVVLIQPSGERFTASALRYGRLYRIKNTGFLAKKLIEYTDH